MENVTPGFEGLNPIGVRSQKVVDNVRFMITNRGSIEMMHTNADIYFIDVDDNLYMYRLTAEDYKARQFDEDECKRVREYMDDMFLPGLSGEFYAASRRL